MTFNEAAKYQYRYGTYYTVWLVKPDGTRVELGFTARKSGTGLLRLIKGKSVQATLRDTIGPEVEYFAIVKKTATALVLSHGWRIEFGGTIREESTR